MLIDAKQLKSAVDRVYLAFHRGDARGLHLIGSGMAVSVRAAGGMLDASMAINATPEGGTFDCHADAVVLAAALSAFVGNVEMSTADNKLILHGNAHATFPVLDATPKMAQSVENRFFVPESWLKSCMAMTGRFASRERGVYALNGAHFEMRDGECSFIACNGRMGAYSTVKCTPGEANFTMPLQCAVMIGSILDESTEESISLGANDGVAIVESTRYRIFTTLLAGRYPDWRRAVPEMGATFQLDSAFVRNVTSALARLELANCRFTASGTELEISARDARMSSFSVKTATGIEPGTMLLAPELISAVLAPSDIQFGWSKYKNAAMVSAPPFTIFCLKIVEQS